MSKTWLITGTSSGFGRLITQKLLARGDRVIATARKPEALADLAQDGLIVETLDITDGAAIRDVVDRSFARGRVDVVVSNAGYAVFGAAEEASEAQIEHQLDTNLLGSLLLIRAAIPRLRAQGGGRILQVSSEGGQIAYPNFSLYHASKWGIEGFVEATALDVAPFGIALTLVEPGPAATDFGKGLVRPARIAEYEKTPAGEVQRAIDSGSFELTGDPDKMVGAMIACADSATPPKRLVLGSTAYHSIEKALIERLDSLRAQKEVAFEADKQHRA